MAEAVHISMDVSEKSAVNPSARQLDKLGHWLNMCDIKEILLV